MFKYSLIIFAFWYQVRGDSVSLTDTGNPSLSSNLNKLSCNETAEILSKKPVITMNGHNNYHVGQQIFYFYNEQQAKRLFADDKHTGQLKYDDYLVSSGIGAHKLHIRKVTWNNARRACIQEGGHLAIINSASEEKILLRIMQENDISSAWLGIHDLYEEGDWVTVLDEALENTGFTRWTTKWANEPDNFGGKQNCGILISEGAMDDVDCDSLVAFFCELPV